MLGKLPPVGTITVGGALVLGAPNPGVGGIITESIAGILEFALVGRMALSASMVNGTDCKDGVKLVNGIPNSCRAGAVPGAGCLLIFSGAAMV